MRAPESLKFNSTLARSPPRKGGKFPPWPGASCPHVTRRGAADPAHLSRSCFLLWLPFAPGCQKGHRCQKGAERRLISPNHSSSPFMSASPRDRTRRCGGPHGSPPADRDCDKRRGAGSRLWPWPTGRQHEPSSLKLLHGLLDGLEALRDGRMGFSGSSSYSRASPPLKPESLRPAGSPQIQIPLPDHGLLPAPALDFSSLRWTAWILSLKVLRTSMASRRRAGSARCPRRARSSSNDP